MSTPTILKKILQRKSEEVSQRRSAVSLAQLGQHIESRDGTRGFVNSIESRLALGQSAVIAEIKKASPSKGVIREDFHPAQIAESYQRAGAACLSVLTDVDFFQGADDYLKQASQVCALPVLRKDFVIDEYQIVEARAIGADCILLIAAALDDSQLRDFYQAAIELGLDVLIEVHNLNELQRILPLGSRLIGINNRDLHSFETSLDNTYCLLEEIPDDRIVVTESGIHDASHVKAMRSHGVNVFLVGEAFMRAKDPGNALKSLFFAE